MKHRIPWSDLWPDLLAGLGLVLLWAELGILLALLKAMQ